MNYKGILENNITKEYIEAIERVVMLTVVLCRVFYLGKTKIQALNQEYTIIKCPKLRLKIWNLAWKPGLKVAESTVFHIYIYIYMCMLDIPVQLDDNCA